MGLRRLHSLWMRYVGRVDGADAACRGSQSLKREIHNAGAPTAWTTRGQLKYKPMLWETCAPTLDSG